ncbi:hypothetical protein [Salipiger sp. IMCC34102]|uniref:hypothetical protein n=1 Tax=Salipiger sp. IMCC34102 TaxID=2510647 RepID=UPI001F5DE01C|nr:hypothetical protein [Salipiger sp. IMCC34102]
MELISDMLLMAGALGAGFYCFILSRRLRKFTDLESGVGGAVARLSAQVDDLTVSVLSAQDTARSSVTTLDEVSARAEHAARHLELLVASMHDLPVTQDPTPEPKHEPERSAPPNPFRARPRETATSQAKAS